MQPVAIGALLATAQLACSVSSGEPVKSGGIETEFAKRARLGQSIGLPSTGGGKVEVVVLSVTDPLEPEGAARESGTRLIGVRLSLRNKSDHAYVGVPIARLGTARRRWLAPRAWLAPSRRALLASRCAERFDSPTTIAAGGGLNVCVPFQIAESSSPNAFRLALVSRAETAGTSRRPPRRLSRRPKPRRPAKNIRAGHWTLR